MVKRNHVIAVFVCVVILMTSVCVSACALTGPMFRKQSEQVTISREEYENLLKYQKLDTLLEYSQMLYYEDVDAEKMLEQAAYGLIYGLEDVYSTYLSKEDMEAFNEEVEGEFAGIGCLLLADSTDKMITVTRVFKNSPAEKAGLRAGDKIVYVNDVYYTAYEMSDAVDVMRGTPGESVKVTVLRDLETIDFDIVREIVNINYCEHEILDGNIGYVIVYDFMGDAIEGFKEAIGAFKVANVKGMILDLRNNSGGLLEQSVELADLILPEGPVVSVKSKYDDEEEFSIDNEYYDVPLVLLVNGLSASASEIVAGAIRDSGEGTIVGTKTFGKGVVQSIFPLPDGSALKITSARYYTPSGECIHEVGIQPHVEVELDENAVTRYGINNLPHEEDAQLQKAVELIESGAVY